MNYNTIVLSSDTLIPTIFGYSFANELENGDRVFDVKHNHIIVKETGETFYSEAFLFELQNKNGLINSIKVNVYNHFISKDNKELPIGQIRIGNILLGTNKSEWKVISKKKLQNEKFISVNLDVFSPIVFDNNPYDLWKNWRGGVHYYKDTPIIN